MVLGCRSNRLKPKNENRIQQPVIMRALHSRLKVLFYLTAGNIPDGHGNSNVSCDQEHLSINQLVNLPVQRLKKFITLLQTSSPTTALLNLSDVSVTAQTTLSHIKLSHL